MRKCEIFTIVRILIFGVGLSLTVWRSFECLEKYINANLSTKVTMVESINTTLPSLVICAESPYNER